MGYQESIFACRTIENFHKLCEKLNTSKSDLYGFITVCAIGKTKVDLTLSNYLTPNKKPNILPANSYFVWVFGERHPFQSGHNLSDEEKETFTPNTSDWECIFCENIVERKNMLFDLDLKNKKGLHQENETVILIDVLNCDYIRDEYLKQL